MHWSPDRSLQARMILAVVAVCLVFLVAAAAAFAALAFVAAIVLALASVSGIGETLRLLLAHPMLIVLGVLAVAGLGLLLQRSGENGLLELAGASGVDAAEYPRLAGVVERTANQANLPTPALAVVDTETPEAFVVGFSPARSTLVVSTGLLDLLPDRELRAVVAHELAHVKNRDVAVMSLATVPRTLVTLERGRPALRERLRGDRFPGYSGELDEKGYPTAEGNDRRFSVRRLVLLLLFPVVVVFFVSMRFGLYLLVPVAAALTKLVFALLSRSRELAADRGAAAISGDPGALAAAIQRIHGQLADTPAGDLRDPVVAAFTVVSPRRTADEPVMLGVDGDEPATVHYLSERYVAPFFSTHPPVEERVHRLRRLERYLERREPSAENAPSRTPPRHDSPE